MSQHRSLRAVGTMGAKRNVLKRFERVALLKKRGQWKEGDKVSGLRKTKPEALKNIKDAIAGYLESLKKHGDPIPPPISEEIVEVAQ